MMEQVGRYSVVAALNEGKMTNGEAAVALGISVRQTQRITAKVRKERPDGVRHGNRDRPSCRAFPAEIRKQAISLANEKQFDFNFSHLSEMPEEQLTIGKRAGMKKKVHNNYPLLRTMDEWATRTR